MTKQKTILITGATTGIGKDAALELVAAGHRVIATGRNPDALARLRSEPNGESLILVHLDVTDAASIDIAAAEVDRITEGAGLDVLINNAGYGMVAPVAETTDEDLRAQYETNVFGLMAVTRAFLPKMLARRSGRIVNVSSIGGRFTLPLFGAYNSSKYAVESLSDALRREVRPFGVDVVLIEPGPIRTEFSKHAIGTVAKYSRETSSYWPLYQRADEIKRQSDALSASPRVVTRVIRRAVESRWPSARYIAPFSSRLLVAFATLFPTRLVDAVFSLTVGLTRRGLRLDAPSPSVPARSAA